MSLAPKRESEHAVLWELPHYRPAGPSRSRRSSSWKRWLRRPAVTRLSGNRSFELGVFHVLVIMLVGIIRVVFEILVGRVLNCRIRQRVPLAGSVQVSGQGVTQP